MSAEKCSAFTKRHTGISLQLRSEVKILADGNTIIGVALWDTGASCSCISHDVAAKLRLIPIGKRTIQTPTGRETVNRYLVDIVLPNDVTVDSVEVCESEIGAQGLNLLVGMDIITIGDFAVSNHNKQTVFSFRVPPQKHIDFVAKNKTAASKTEQRK